MENEMLPSLEDYTEGRIKTLGWDVLSWGSEMLGQPDGLNKGDAWQYTNEQALFVLRFYSINKSGRFIFRRAVLERAKGWGKSPLLAAICCTELLGPTRFGGWNENGEPIGVRTPSPLIQIAAISDDQADNTMLLVGEMLAEGEAAYYYRDLEIMMSKVTYRGGKIQKVTASPRGRQGNRATFVVMDETHLWVPAEKGPELADALRNNLTKMDARSIETTNAHAPGEGSVAEDSYQAFLKMQSGQTFDKGLLFDTREKFVEDIYDHEQAYPALVEVYGDSCTENGGWMNLGRVWADINDPSWSEPSARRFFFNEKTEGKSTWLAERDWKGCHDSNLHLVLDEETFALGFKGAVRHGAAALVACRLEDNALFLLGLWERPEGSSIDWEVPYLEVEGRIRKLLKLKQCFKMVADPEHWQEIMARIAADHDEKVEEFWINQNRTKAAHAIEQFETAVKTKRLRWGDPNLSRHVLACHTYETNQGVLIRKENPSSKRYISAAQAAVLALESAVLSIEEGGLRPQTNYIYSF